MMDQEKRYNVLVEYISQAWVEVEATSPEQAKHRARQLALEGEVSSNKWEGSGIEAIEVELIELPSGD